MESSPISRRRFLRKAGVLGAFGLVASYPVLVERFLVQVNHYRVPVPNLPEAFQGFRVVHLTDLHHGRFVPLEVIRWVVGKANALRGDLVVCTGDYVRERNGTTALDGVWPVLSGLKARCGVYSVLGNHDYWADPERARYWLERSGQALHHQVAPIEQSGQRFWLVGAGDFTEDSRPLDRVLEQVPEPECRVVLAHNPDTADTGYSGRCDLMIAGHTHGGQVRLPVLGAPVLPVRNRNYTSGLKTSPKGEPVFISRGIGFSILPVRFNCYPEIAVLELGRGGPEDVSRLG